MDTIERLKLVSSHMDLEPVDVASCPRLRSTGDERPSSQNKGDIPFVSEAVMPNGKRITLLKSLLTSSCERNCYYCPFRAGRDFHRITFKPDEMAQTFMALHRAGIVQGIFLSSGVAGGGMRTQDKLLATAEILRTKFHYRGYLHLKLMPGAEKDQVLRAMQLSNRVSVNLEAPNALRLERLAPRKNFAEELLQPLRWVEEIRQAQPKWQGWNGHWPSVTTQFVVGAVGENDLELLSTTTALNRQVHLRRAYFSAFRPITDTPMENLAAESPVREQRLYQASFLLRDYGFDLEDLPFDADGKLPLDLDPKTAWAQTNLSAQPVEINLAGRQELLRIPGIGPVGAAAILSARQKGSLRNLEDLHKIGVNPTQAVPYILLDGRRPAQQLAFW